MQTSGSSLTIRRSSKMHSALANWQLLTGGPTYWLPSLFGDIQTPMIWGPPIPSIISPTADNLAYSWLEWHLWS